MGFITIFNTELILTAWNQEINPYLMQMLTILVNIFTPKIKLIWKIFSNHNKMALLKPQLLSNLDIKATEVKKM